MTDFLAWWADHWPLALVMVWYPIAAYELMCAWQRFKDSHPIAAYELMCAWQRFKDSRKRGREP